MTSPPSAKHAEPGSQPPRFCHIPQSVSSAGDEAVDLARMAGLNLDYWQDLTLRHSLDERPDGKWSAFEVGVNVPRQNGKGAILEARELAGLFLLGERLIIHSAHEFATSLEAFRRLLALIEDTPEFERRIKRVSRAHGEEGIELTNRQRIRFRTRTKGGGRGFSGDCLIFDEAMFLPAMAHGALLPTLSARPNPQVWYTGSAVDQDIHEDGQVFGRIRERGIKGEDPALLYMEWSAEAEDPESLSDALAGDPAVWGQANPGLAIRISHEHIERERRSMDPRTFAVERLGVGDWPQPGGGSGIDFEHWDTLVDLHSQPRDPVSFIFDVRPDRTSASIAVAARRDDELIHVEIVDHRPGTGWIVPRLVELDANHDGGICCDGASPAASLIPQAEAAGLTVETVGAQEYAKACGRFFDAIEESTLRHLGTPELAAALKAAARRPLGDAWAWSRKTSAADISPLVAATLALWKAEAAPARSKVAHFL
jgi:hypothetical protein